MLITSFIKGQLCHKDTSNFALWKRLCFISQCIHMTTCIYSVAISRNILCKGRHWHKAYNNAIHEAT